jgi:hypothetical protein
LRISLSVALASRRRWTSISKISARHRCIRLPPNHHLVEMPSVARWRPALPQLEGDQIACWMIEAGQRCRRYES